MWLKTKMFTALIALRNLRAIYEADCSDEQGEIFIMRSKLVLIIIGMAAIVSAAFPVLASAGEPQIDPASGKFALTFTMSGGFSELQAVNEPEIRCSAVSGSGKYNTSTTGELSLTFHGCTTSFFGFPVSCNTGGAESGVVVTNSSVFHNTYVTDAKTTPGILVTPPVSGVFATIICGTFATIEIRGNGFLGRLEAPKCGEKKKIATLNLTATGSSQSYKQVTGTGTAFNLISRTESTGKDAEAAEIVEVTATFTEEATLTCV